MYRFLLFDLDDTILDFGKAERCALIRALEGFGIALSDAALARYSEINAEEWRRLERGECTRDEVKLNRFVRFCKEYSLAADPASLRTTYEGNLAEGHFFVDGAEELLEALGKMPNKRLFLVSNGTTAVQRGRLASAGISHRFEGIFLSEEVGFVKPQKEFFDACFAAIPGFCREEAIILGDSLTSDIAGGKNASIATCYFSTKTTGDEPSADFTIHRLSDFLKIVK